MKTNGRPSLKCLAFSIVDPRVVETDILRDFFSTNKKFMIWRDALFDSSTEFSWEDNYTYTPERRQPEATAALQALGRETVVGLDPRGLIALALRTIGSFGPTLETIARGKRHVLFGGGVISGSSLSMPESIVPNYVAIRRASH